MTLFILVNLCFFGLFVFVGHVLDREASPSEPRCVKCILTFATLLTVIVILFEGFIYIGIGVLGKLLGG